uniref:Uncharacterized protein n=1 Tax=Rhizophora mucronata TaxID=61149 RepID=A0A2P2PAH2_RHIMU
MMLVYKYFVGNIGVAIDQIHEGKIYVIWNLYI